MCFVSLVAHRFGRVEFRISNIFLSASLACLKKQRTFVSNFCRNDELSWLFTNRFSATRYMKVKKMGMTKSL